jgi:NADP-dependent 3-hydroxy acid dehydrogenase YdfG
MSAEPSTSTESGHPLTSHLNGRVVVVTGAAGGFGRLIAEMAAARGAKVVIGDIDGEAADATAAAVCATGADAVGLAADVTDLGQVEALAALAVERFGAVDVMVNNAGIMPLAFFRDHREAHAAWGRCIDINIKGVLNGICAVHDQMIQQGRGHVVNISSIYANAGTAGSGVYSATKAAVIAMSDSLRVESQGKIRVTVVRPTGVMGTGLGSTVINPEAVAGIAGANADALLSNVMAYFTGELDPALSDIDNPAYWAIAPDVIAGEVIHAMDQPWGVCIGDVTVRATGEQYVL